MYIPQILKLAAPKFGSCMVVHSLMWSYLYLLDVYAGLEENRSVKNKVYNAAKRCTITFHVYQKKRLEIGLLAGVDEPNPNDGAEDPAAGAPKAGVEPAGAPNAGAEFAGAENAGVALADAPNAAAAELAGVPKVTPELAGAPKAAPEFGVALKAGTEA